MSELQPILRSEMPEWVHEFTDIYTRLMQANSELVTTYGPEWTQLRYAAQLNEAPNLEEIELVVQRCGMLNKEALGDLTEAVIKQFGQDKLPKRMWGGSYHAEPKLRYQTSVFFLPRENKLVAVPHNPREGFLAKAIKKIVLDENVYHWNQSFETPISEWCYTGSVASDIVYRATGRYYSDYIRDPDYPYQN